MAATPTRDDHAKAASKLGGVLSLVASVILSSACSSAEPEAAAAARADAITRSSPDATDDAVVALVQGGKAMCSGTLISPHVVLTAGHCVGDARAFDVFFGARYVPGAPLVHAHLARVHPGFVRASLDDDVALIALEEPAPPAVRPARISPQVDAAEAWEGRIVRLVGFGVTDDPAAPPDQKRQGTTHVTAATDRTLVFESNGSLTCGGDSGGPAFTTLNGVEYLAGVTSSGDTACRARAVDMRVDAYFGDFIAPFIAAIESSVADIGAPCAYDAQCRTGRCIPASDDPAVYVCSQACRTDAMCPAPMECGARGLCEHRAPTPSALGAECREDDDCLRQICVPSHVGTPSRCGATCWPGAVACAREQGTCVAHEHATGAFACDPGLPASDDTPARGCSLARGAAQSWRVPVFAMVLLLRLAMHRRRRTGAASSPREADTFDDTERGA